MIISDHDDGDFMDGGHRALATQMEGASKDGIRRNVIN
jgi:hypothetical protein